MANLVFAAALRLKQLLAPATPKAGENTLYFKSDDKLYSKNSAGTEVVIGPSSGGVIRDVRALIFANVSLASCSTSQDGVTLVAGDRVLVTRQTTGGQNGVYTVGTVAGGLAPLTRHPSFNTSALIATAGVVEVAEGTVYGGSGWMTTWKATNVLDTDAMSWAQVVAPTVNSNVNNGVYISGDLSGNTPRVLAGGTSGTLLTSPGSGLLPTWTANNQQALRSVVKDWCRVATTLNLASLSTLLTIDGITLVAGDRVLVKNQSVQTQNGVYVAASGAWSRSLDMADGPAITGAEVPVALGTVNGGTTWKVSGWIATNTPGTNALLFYQVGLGINPVAQVLSVSVSAITATTFTGIGSMTGGDAANNPYLSGTTAGTSTFSKAGMYSITCWCTIAAGTAGRRILQLNKNGVEVTRLDGSNAGQPWTGNLTWVMPMAVGDTLNLAAYSSVATTFGASPGHGWTAWRISADTAYATVAGPP